MLLARRIARILVLTSAFFSLVNAALLDVNHRDVMTLFEGVASNIKSVPVPKERKHQCFHSSSFTETQSVASTRMPLMRFKTSPQNDTILFEVIRDCFNGCAEIIVRFQVVCFSEGVSVQHLSANGTMSQTYTIIPLSPVLISQTFYIAHHLPSGDVGDFVGEQFVNFYFNEPLDGMGGYLMAVNGLNNAEVGLYSVQVIEYEGATVQHLGAAQSNAAMVTIDIPEMVDPSTTFPVGNYRITTLGTGETDSSLFSDVLIDWPTSKIRLQRCCSTASSAWWSMQLVTLHDGTAVQQRTAILTGQTSLMLPLTAAFDSSVIMLPTWPVYGRTTVETDARPCTLTFFQFTGDAVFVNRVDAAYNCIASFSVLTFVLAPPTTSTTLAVTSTMALSTTLSSTSTSAITSTTDGSTTAPVTSTDASAMTSVTGNPVTSTSTPASSSSPASSAAASDTSAQTSLLSSSSTVMENTNSDIDTSANALSSTVLVEDTTATANELLIPLIASGGVVIVILLLFCLFMCLFLRQRRQDRHMLAMTARTSAARSSSSGGTMMRVSRMSRRSRARHGHASARQSYASKAPSSDGAIYTNIQVDPYSSIPSVSVSGDTYAYGDLSGVLGGSRAMPPAADEYTSAPLFSGANQSSYNSSPLALTSAYTNICVEGGGGGN